MAEKKASRKTNKNNKASAQSKVRMDEALALRITGLSYAKIGNAMGISKTQAYNLVDAALTDIKENITEKAEALRALELERMDEMLAAIWPSIVEPGDDGPNQFSIDRALKIMKSRRELLGLDVVHTTDDDLESPPVEVHFHVKDAKGEIKTVNAKP